MRTDEIVAEAEQSFHLVVSGPRGAGKSTLIGRLAGGGFGVVEPFALRRLIELDAPLSPEALRLASQSELVLWLRDVTRPEMDDGSASLRERASAFLSVANKADLRADPQAGFSAMDARGAICLSALSGSSVRQVLIPAVLDAAPGLALALGRQFSIFRDEVADREIRRFARVNAEVAVVSAIPQASLLLGPVSAVADTVVLTKNQGILLLRLAAMFGLSLDRRRLAELAPVVGAAFGWRTLARELVGFLPAGLGVVPKAIIAYAGTVAAGRAGLWYYQTGRKIPEARLKQIYAESAVHARSLARELSQRLRRAG